MPLEVVVVVVVGALLSAGWICRHPKSCVPPLVTLMTVMTMRRLRLTLNELQMIHHRSRLPRLLSFCVFHFLEFISYLPLVGTAFPKIGCDPEYYRGTRGIKKQDGDGWWCWFGTCLSFFSVGRNSTFFWIIVCLQRIVLDNPMGLWMGTKCLCMYKCEGKMFRGQCFYFLRMKGLQICAMVTAMSSF